MEASYEDIMDALKTQYDDITETEALLSELFSTIQGEKESVAEFGGDFIQYYTRLNSPKETREEKMMNFSNKISSEA